MNCRIVDIKRKEVINIEDGNRIGYVGDVEIDMQSGKVFAIVISGKLKLFGLLGRQEDIIIEWEKVHVIGEEIILVYYETPHNPKRKSNNKLLNNFFGD
jgi:YlmC/YmxH family sporulation protein